MSQIQSQTIRSQGPAIAQALVAREFLLHPELEKRYGQKGREKCLEDAGYHLAYLAEAVEAENPELFADYVSWVKVMLCCRGITQSDLLRQLESLKAIFSEMPDLCASAASFLELAIARLQGFPEKLPSLLKPGEAQGKLAKEYLKALLRGDRHGASSLILKAAERGVDVKEIYLKVFQPEVAR